MDLKSFRVFAPVLITAAAIIGLALGPGSRPSLDEPSTPTVLATVPSLPTATIEAIEIVAHVATETAAPPTLPPATATRAATPTRAPTTTPSPVLRTIRVPILMYHYVSIPPPDADKYRLDLSVSPEMFQAQMDYLAANGFHPVRLMDLAEYLQNGTALPDKPIVLTFDDGYSDNYANAFPVLRDHKFPATFFVIVNAIEENRWGYMNWSQLSEMASAGLEMGSHTLSHPDLKGKSRSYQTKEITDSKQLITSRLGIPVLSFSYPAGSYDANALAIVKSAGYTSAVIDAQGESHSSEALFELKRIRVRGSYTIADFAFWLKWYAENGK